MQINQYEVAFYAGAIVLYLSDILQKRTSNQLAPWAYIQKRSRITFLFSFLATAIITGFTGIPSLPQLAELIGACLVCAFGFYFFIRAINQTHFSNVSSLSIVGNVIQWAIGWLIFYEKVSWLDIPAMALMASGCLLQLFNTKLNRGAVYVLMSSLFWVVGFSLLSTVLKKVNLFWSIPVMELTLLLISVVALKVSMKPKQESQQVAASPPIFYLILIAASIYAGSILNHYGFQNIPLSTISLLQLSLRPLGYFLSLRLFKERPSKLEWIGFGLGIIGLGYQHFIRHLLL